MFIILIFWMEEPEQESRHVTFSTICSTADSLQVLIMLAFSL